MSIDLRDPAVGELIRLATVSQEHEFWPEEVVREARTTLLSRYGHVPTLQDLCTHYPPDLVFGYARVLIDRRVADMREVMERMGHDSPCHLCRAQRASQDPTYTFGLARVIEKKTNWGGALGMLALNVVTMPLGIGVAARPGSSTTANIARCRLVMCANCGAQRRGFFGGSRISEHDCRYHPSWSRLWAAGFTTFLDAEQLSNYH